MRHLLILLTAIVSLHTSPVKGFILGDVWDNVKNLFASDSPASQEITDLPEVVTIENAETQFGVLWGMPDTEAFVGHLFKNQIPSNALKGGLGQYALKVCLLLRCCLLQCKRKTLDHGPGLANNLLGRRQIVICSAQGPTSTSHIYADRKNLGLHNITWAGIYSLPAQVSGNNYGTLVYTVIILIVCHYWD